MRSDYRAWLEQQEYSGNTISTQCSHASRLEHAYGDLDEHYAQDRLEGIMASLRYSADEERRGLPNPSKLSINGDLYKSLASFRTAIALYRRFLEDSVDGQPASVPLQEEQKVLERERRERIGLERDLQKTLRQMIGQLEEGLQIIDEGVERPVSSGFIDITARDTAGSVVVIELKAGTADRTAIGQILSYMGDLAGEESAPVRGILVAHDFDHKAMAAASMVPNLQLRTYSVQFVFGDPT